MVGPLILALIPHWLTETHVQSSIIVSSALSSLHRFPLRLETSSMCLFGLGIGVHSRKRPSFAHLAVSDALATEVG